MAATKIDWQYHIQNYLDQHADSMSLPDYARANSLNINTVRRAMGPAVAATIEARKKSNHDSATKIQDSGIKLCKPVRRKVREIVADTRMKQMKSDLLADHRSPDRLTKKGFIQNPKHPKTLHSNPNNAKNDGVDSAEDSVSSDESNFQDWNSIRRPHTPAMAFGGYTSRLEIDDEVLALAKVMAQSDDDLLISESRLIMMVTRQNQILKCITHDYSNGRPWTDDDGNVIPKSQAEAQILYGPSQQMTQLEAHIGRRKQNIRKQAIAQLQIEQEKHPLALNERIERTRQLLQQRADLNMSALETTKLFEMEGITLPESLRAEMLKEVSWMEQEIDMYDGISDAELERLSREYEAKRKHEIEKWLPTRRAEIAKMIAEESAYQAGELIGEDTFTGLTEEVIIEGGTISAWNDGDWSSEDSDSEPEEDW